MKTYLVCGVLLVIGTNFIHYIFRKYGEQIRILNLDKLTYAGDPKNLADVSDRPNYTFIKGDICDKELVNRIFRDNLVDYVVHFAAESHVDRSIAAADAFVTTNILGTFTLLDAAMRAWTCGEPYGEGCRYLPVPPGEVYGSVGPAGYFTETTPLDPHSPYSASKASADLLVKSYFDTHRLPVNITRCSNNYGPYQYPEKLIPLLITNCLAHKPLPVYGDGLNVRDWLYVEDHCRAIDLVLHHGVAGEIYNIGGHNEKTNIEIVRLIVSYMHDHVDA